MFPQGVGNGKRERASDSQLQKGNFRKRRMRVALFSTGSNFRDGVFEVMGHSG